MSNLDHKIPPPIVTVLCVALAWLIARFTPELAYFPFAVARIPVVVVFVLVGFALDVSGLIAFRKAKTTVNPRAPERSTAIVRDGPYRFTRNPMYLGLIFMLFGFCVYLGNPLSLLAIVVFFAYITRFQIMPEERLLLAKFGEPYAQYMGSVRRWI